MRLLCLMLAAVSASAAGIDIDAPGFWTKGYAIPRSYCELRLALASPRVEKLVKIAAPCEFNARNGGVQSECHLPREEAMRIIAELRRVGTLTGYAQDCDAAPEFPELYYKRDNLKREWAELGLIDAGAIAGLMATQISTLEQLIARHEAARETVLNVIITANEPSPPLGNASDSRSSFVAEKFARVSKHAIKISSLPPSEIAWARRSRPVCEQVDTITVVYENGPESENIKRLAAANRLGAAYDDQSCPHLNGIMLGTAIFSPRPEPQIRKFLMELPGLKSWTVARLNGDDGVVPDDIRFDRLSAELLAHKEKLSRAPHVRGLVVAEIERVRDSSQMLHILRKGHLLLLRFR